eukprot:m.25133 g.25133  ORF g.25133 m.25133 type:complete len:144 (+) comp11414_c0_seq1:255-686(+)
MRYRLRWRPRMHSISASINFTIRRDLLRDWQHDVDTPVTRCTRLQAVLCRHSAYYCGDVGVLSICAITASRKWMVAHGPTVRAVSASTRPSFTMRSYLSRSSLLGIGRNSIRALGANFLHVAATDSRIGSGNPAPITTTLTGG